MTFAPGMTDILRARHCGAATAMRHALGGIRLGDALDNTLLIDPTETDAARLRRPGMGDMLVDPQSAIDIGVLAENQTLSKWFGCRLWWITWDLGTRCHPLTSELALGVSLLGWG